MTDAGIAIDTFMKAAAACAAAVFALTAPPVQAAQETAVTPVTQAVPPVRVTAALEQKQGVMQGEAVRLRFGFRDASGKGLFAQTYTDLRWCTFELRQGGNVVKAWAPRQRYVTGNSRMPFHVMDLETPRSESVTLLPDLTQVPPGEYTLRVSTRVKYGPADYVRSHGNLHSSPAEARDTFDFPLVVRPLDEAVMRQRISLLYLRLLREKDAAKFDVLSYELARMPPALAERTWRSLLRSPKVLDRYRFAQTLAGVPSKPVADTLIHTQLTNPVTGGGGRMENLVSLLKGMEVSAESAEVGRYIREQLHKHRDRLLGVPVNLD